MLKTDCTEKNGFLEEIESMKVMAGLLQDCSFPKVSFEEELQILCLKQRSLTIDGYDINVCYSQSDYEDHILETLQLQSAQVPFIPFNVVCKVAKLVMGVEKLAYIDFFRYNKKVYCWAVKNFDGKRVEPNVNSKKISYEGFEFYLLDPSSVDLF